MKEKVWKYRPGDVVQWVPTHGVKADPIKGIVITTLPRFEGEYVSSRQYGDASVYENQVVQVLAEAVEKKIYVNSNDLKPGFFAKKLKKIFLATQRERYLIWIPEIRGFRTPGKSVVEEGA